MEIQDIITFLSMLVAALAVFNLILMFRAKKRREDAEFRKAMERGFEEMRADIRRMSR